MLGDDLAAALPELQAHAESRMASRATIWRKNDLDPQDEATGSEDPGWVREHIGLPCRIGSDRGAAPSRTANTPGGDIQLGLRTFHCPASTANLADGDLIEVTAGENAGTIWRIIESDPADQQTARRLPVISHDRPEEWL